MAQAAAGFPWNRQSQDLNPILSEKPVQYVGRDSQSENHVEITNHNVQSQVSRTPTEKHKQHNKHRKRAASVKPQTSFIPQTREEVDAHLSYGATHHYNVRTIPPWVRDAEEDDIVDDVNDILDSPHTALVAQHNSNPSNTLRSSRHERARQGGYLTSSGNIRPDRTSRWVTFARASAYPRENFHTEKVDVEWLNNNLTDYSKPWLSGHKDESEDDSKYRTFQRKKAVWYKRAQFVILRNPFVPLAFRFIVILFAAIAIGLGAAIFNDSGRILRCTAQAEGQRDQECAELIGQGPVDYFKDPSGLMAVIVDILAIVYSFYITYDEYFSKPLGLRSARAKVRLVLLDLFFICFQSANLSLAFESLTVVDGPCTVGNLPRNIFTFSRICDRAQALSSVLLVSLVAWLLTFSVSVLRLVERMNTK